MIQNEIGIAPYTERVLATSYKGALIFHLYEDLHYEAAKECRITIYDAISVAGLITSILGLNPNAPLISLLGLLFSAGSMIPSGTEMEIYTVSAVWDRYVKKRDSAILLTIPSQHYITFTGYANPITGNCELHLESRSESYYTSKAYFNDLYGQLEEGYQEYVG